MASIISVVLTTKAISLLKLFPLLLILVTLLDYIRMLLIRRHLPPGPFPLPLIGNHFQTPSVRPWITWQKWSHYYNNPLTTLWIGRHPRIIVQDAWTASELMEKKSELLSSRPRLVVMGDLIGATETNQTTMVYGDRWRMHRKLMVSQFLIHFSIHFLTQAKIELHHISLPHGLKLAGCNSW